MTAPTAALIPLHQLKRTSRADTDLVMLGDRGAVTWREFSTGVANWTQRLQSRPEPRWLLADEGVMDFCIKLLALIGAGRHIVIPPNHLASTVRQLQQQDAFDARTDALALLPGDAATDFKASIDPNHVVIDLYTSGSTGEPKCIRKNLAYFELEIAAQEALWGERAGDSAIVATAPHHHIYGLLFRIFWPLSTGRLLDTVTCQEPSTLQQRLVAMSAYKAVSVLISSPAQLTRFPDWLPLIELQPAPRLIFSSGGPLPAATAVHYFEQLGGAPIEIFGSTETGGIAWRQQTMLSDAWTPLPGITVTRDADDGALLLQSPFLQTEALLRMDDAVALLPQGRFQLKGRLDRTVKIEEKRLSLPEMEAVLARHEWITAAALVVLDSQPADAPSRLTLGAVLVLAATGTAEWTRLGKHAATQALRRYLAEHFDAVLLPRRWRVVVALPFNERSKSTPAALKALFAAAS